MSATFCGHCGHSEHAGRCELCGCRVSRWRSTVTGAVLVLMGAMIALVVLTFLHFVVRDATIAAGRAIVSACAPLSLPAPPAGRPWI